LSSVQTKMRGGFRGTFLFWMFLLVLRASALFFGLDRLPLLPTVGDEVIINDPAVALSRGYGLVAFSFGHSTIGLDRMYAHFPPLFIWLQALAFRMFGFSGLTLRAPSVVFDLAACSVFLAILLELGRHRFAENWSIALSGALLLLEPVTLAHSRQGRMESLSVLLGGIAFFLAIRAERSAKYEKALWLTGAVSAGLALSTHPASLIVWAGFVGWSLRRLKHLGAMNWLFYSAVPPLVFFVVWGVTFREKALDALLQMHRAGTYSPGPSLRLGELASSVAAGDLRVANSSGGPALLVTLGCLVIGLWRTCSARRASHACAAGGWWAALVTLTGIVLAQSLLLQFVVPTSGFNRVLMAVPFAYLCAACAFSYLGDSGRRFAMAVIFFVVVAEIGVLGLYLGQLRHSWADRSKDRFDQILNVIPENARVAAVPEFWYALLIRKHNFTVVYHDMDESRYFRENPDSFDPYDAVILDPAASDYATMLRNAEKGHAIQVRYRTYERTFVLLARSLRAEGAAVRANPLGF